MTATYANVDAERRANSGVSGEPPHRVVVYDTTSTLPVESSPNISSRWPKARARKVLNAIGWGMYHAYSPGVRLERARMTITLRVCRRWSQTLPAYRPDDHDNLLAACKGLIDGIVRAGLLADDKATYLEPPRAEVVEVDTPYEEGLLVRVEETDLPARSYG